MTTLIDTRTMLILITLVMIGRACILGYVWLVTRRYPPLTYWAAGAGLLAAGSLFLGLRGLIPHAASILLGQAGVLVGWLVSGGGVVIAADRQPPWRAGAAVVAGALAVVAWYTLVTPDYPMRTLATSLPPLVTDLYAAVICLQYRGSSRQTTFRLLGVLQLISAASNLLKLQYTFEAHVDNLFDAAWQISQFYVISAIATVVGSVIFVLLAAQSLQEKLDQEIEQRRIDQQRLAKSEVKYRSLFETTTDAVIMLNHDGFVGCNRSALEMFGCATEAEFCAQCFASLSPPEQPGLGQSATLVREHVARALAEGHAVYEWVHRRADTGATFPAEVQLSAMAMDNEVVLQASVRDISERKRMEESVRQLAFLDSLTKLPNRRLLADRMAMAMAASKRSGEFCCLLFIDLDNFKPLNDANGHEVGDLLLMEVAARLQATVRASDTVARLGGDEFVILLGDLPQELDDAQQVARSVADKVQFALSVPYHLRNPQADGARADVNHTCSASIGGTLFCGDLRDRDELLREADTAMYAAKRAGRRTVRFFAEVEGAHHDALVVVR